MGERGFAGRQQMRQEGADKVRNQNRAKEVKYSKTKRGKRRALGCERAKESFPSDDRHNRGIYQRRQTS